MHFPWTHLVVVEKHGGELSSKRRAGDGFGRFQPLVIHVVGGAADVAAHLTDTYITVRIRIRIRIRVRIGVRK